MSANGTNNIMAYSWPSHVKKYLDAIEAEKRFQRSTKVGQLGVPCAVLGTGSDA